MNLTKEIVLQAIDNCNELQHKIMISVMYYAGATAKDIMHLEYKDFSINGKFVMLGRVAYPLPGHVITLLNEFVAQKNRKYGLIFLTKFGKPLHFNYIRTTISDAFNCLSVKPLDLRHLRVSEWRSQYGNTSARRMARMYVRG
jgi:integrase